VQTLNSELGALEAALGRQRDPGELVAEVEERRRQAIGFNPAALPGPGSPMPDGDLTDITDTPTTLHATRDGPPADVVFYRGGWCPYCNLALRTYERDLVPVVRSRGATLIAISADTPDGSRRGTNSPTTCSPTRTTRSLDSSESWRRHPRTTRPPKHGVQPSVHPQLVSPRTPDFRSRRLFSSTAPASSNGSTSTPTTSPEQSLQRSSNRWI
jgi:hypothetical protein